ncbi:hypothetical protein GCM10010517_75310 [Streptosporangium fragile]|uniref:Uncharacterized protein n=1 Tax=Streptosporangium fragile TaxID=46186 RepID=A0ABP6ITI2_9ACTN
MHAQVVLSDGFDPLDAIAPYEDLYAAGAATDGAVSVEGAREVPRGTPPLTLRSARGLSPALRPRASRTPDRKEERRSPCLLPKASVIRSPTSLRASSTG